MLQSAVPLLPASLHRESDLDQLLEEARALAERVDRRLRERMRSSAATTASADAQDEVEN